MKTTMNILILSIISTLSFSCSDDMYTPDAAVKTTFKSMFPKAVFVDWEMEAGYVNAEFTHDGARKDAWFETNGTWLMTETDIRSSKIPAAIKNALDKSEYAGWRIDDVDYLEFANAEPLYVLDMEKGESEVDLYFAADGTLKEAKQDSDLKYHMP
jgi:hypothetical protein